MRAPHKRRKGDAIAPHKVERQRFFPGGHGGTVALYLRVPERSLKEIHRRLRLLAIRRNLSNKGSDYFFQSIGDGNATPGERADTFMTDTQSKGALPILTIPMVGYVAKLGANRNKLSSFFINKYGPQTGSNWQWFPDAGNGVSTAPGNPFITGNNPLDANVASSTSFRVQHLVSVHVRRLPRPV